MLFYISHNLSHFLNPVHEFLNGKHAAFNSHRYQSNPGLFTNVRARVESLTENWVKFHFSELEKCIFWEPTLLKEVFLREKYRELNRKRYRKMQEENSHNALCTIILWAAESIDPESVAGMPLLGINSLSPLFFLYPGRYLLKGSNVQIKPNVRRRRDVRSRKR